MDGSEGVGPVREIPIGLHGGGLPVASPGGAPSGSRASSATSGGGSRIFREGDTTHG
jgi:hypothetical protein